MSKSESLSSFQDTTYSEFSRGSLKAYIGVFAVGVSSGVMVAEHLQNGGPTWQKIVGGLIGGLTLGGSITGMDLVLFRRDRRTSQQSPVVEQALEIGLLETGQQGLIPVE